MKYNKVNDVVDPTIWPKFETLLKTLRGKRIQQAQVDKTQVIAIEAPTLMGKSWLIGRIIDRCRTAKLPTIHLDFSDLPRPVDGIVTWLDLFAGAIGEPKLSTALRHGLVEYDQGEISSPLTRLHTAVYPHLNSHPVLNQFARFEFDMMPDALGGTGDNVSTRLMHLLDRLYAEQRLGKLFDYFNREFPSKQFEWRRLALEVAAYRAQSASQSLRDDVQQALSNLFFSALQAHLELEPHSVFLIDAAEQMPSEVARWFEIAFWPRLRQFPFGAVVVCSRGSVAVPSHQLFRLQPFSAENMPPPAFIQPERFQRLLEQSAGIPGVLARLIDLERRRNGMPSVT